MAQLLVRNISEALVRTLKLRAAEHGISAEEEHRRILAEQLLSVSQAAPYDFKDHLSALAEDAGDENDWLFDRHDPRNIRPWREFENLFED